VRANSPSSRKLRLRSGTALVIDQDDDRTLYAKNAQAALPIASITKLMTAMVILDAELPMDAEVTIAKADKDRLRYSRSRLRVGETLTRAALLRLALMASENRAAAALARTYPGGFSAFLQAMNEKAGELGMPNSLFVDATGLQGENTATAEDLAVMVKAAYNYDLIRELTTTPAYSLRTRQGRLLEFRNTNRLLRRSDWEIGLSKTGYIRESGRCLVLQARIAARQLIIVLLNAQGKYTGFGDANRIRKWLEAANQTASL
jgi:D-alanyl-D-alanine endopeptidase (penicillin-binding protein 7)